MSISTNSIINNEYLYPLKKIKISLGKVDINTLLKFEILQNLIEENKVFENKFGKSIKNIGGFSCKRTQLNKELLHKLFRSQKSKGNSDEPVDESDDSETNPEFINFIEETRKRQIKEEKKVDPKDRVPDINDLN